MKRKIILSEKEKNYTLLRNRGLSKATASRGAKRGWYYEEYHTRNISVLHIDEQEAKFLLLLAQRVFYKHFTDLTNHKEDLIQESILYLLEGGGNIKAKNNEVRNRIYARFLKNGMYNYINKFIIRR